MPPAEPILRFLSLSSSLLCLTILVPQSVCAEAPPDYGRDIQPLLAKHCVLCHGPDEKEAGLRLDQSASATAKLESGNRGIVAGKPEQSEILRRVTTNDEDLRMPPEGPRLSDQQVALLTGWIERGGKFETHWAYRPIKPPPLPTLQDESSVRNPIDQFVLSRLESAGLTPSPVADPAILAKRLSYDLVGLPPDPAQLSVFISDPTDTAYEAMVDQLLSSKHFGERWGRHWLDKARYADSDGYEKDKARPNAWLYRDWVINAINRDMPYDQFTIEQLAGDLHPNASGQQRLATAFHRQTLTNTEGGVDQEEFRVEATFDRTETTSAIWLGLTMTCARCHTHKYDQISQREYYQLFAFFDDLNETNATLPESEAEQQKYDLALAEHQSAMQKLESRYASVKAELQPEVDAWIIEMEQKLNAEHLEPLEFTVAKPVIAKSTHGAELKLQDDGSLLVSGAVPDKDKYTLVFDLPAKPLTGIKVELIPDESLPSKGPGRAPNGNLVLTQVRSFIGPDTDFKKGHEPIEWNHAEADHSQSKFSPEGALSTKARSGWAIAPAIGKPHHWIGLTTDPPSVENCRFIQVVLDQQYGGQHLIGRFRISTISGYDPLRTLPKSVSDSLREPADKRTPAQLAVIAEHVARQQPKAKALIEKIAKHRAATPKPPTMSVRVVAATKRSTRILHRGDFLQPADTVETNALGVILQTLPLKARTENQPPDRHDLANWLIDPSHPLTPRVTANHIWANLFGRGIVATVNDFGVRGDRPSHPELLDWLAWQLPRDLKWSRKALIRTIVMSATYRQASKHRDDLKEIDPTNLLLARQNRVRVTAEVVRDLHLAVSGLLSSKTGGPSVFPPLPSGVAELSYNNNFKWKTSDGEDAYRRGIYTFFKRTSPHPTLISFDCPDSNTTHLQRTVSNTPLQALVTLNNGVFAEAAQAFTVLVLSESGATDEQRLSRALQRVLTRAPMDAELQRFAQLLDTSRKYYTEHPDDAEKVTTMHRFAGLSIAENAAWVTTLRMVLNLDEFIVRD